MKFVVILLALAVLAALFLIGARRRIQDDGSEDSADYMPRDVKGMKLIPGQKACAEALRKAAALVPPNEPTRLPLPGCTRKRCNCRFTPVAGRRLENRREGSDRREQVRFGPDATDRRSGVDRREQGHDPWRIGDNE